MSSENKTADLYYHPAEGLNRPHWKRFRPQGIGRLLVKVYDKSEYKTAGGIHIPVDHIDQPHHGRIIGVSSDFGDPSELKVFKGPAREFPFRFALKLLRYWNRLRHPGITVGANVVALPQSWITFQCLDDRLAWCPVNVVIGAYDWKGPDTIEKESKETRAAADKHHEDQMAAYRKAADTLPNPDIPSLISVRETARVVDRSGNRIDVFYTRSQ